MTKVFASFDGRAIVPDQPLELSEGDRLEVTIEVVPSDATRPRNRTAAALLAAVRSPPHLSPEDLDEFDRALESGKVAPNNKGEFDDLSE